MTVEEYAVKEKEEFDNANIPQEFRSAISSAAEDRGLFGCGYIEILIYLRAYVYVFKGPIKAFEQRIRTEAYERKQQ